MTTPSPEKITICQPSTPAERQHCLITPSITIAEGIEFQRELGKPTHQDIIGAFQEIIDDAPSLLKRTVRIE